MRRLHQLNCCCFLWIDGPFFMLQNSDRILSFIWCKKKIANAFSQPNMQRKFRFLSSPLSCKIGNFRQQFLHDLIRPYWIFLVLPLSPPLSYNKALLKYISSYNHCPLFFFYQCRYIRYLVFAPIQRLRGIWFFFGLDWMELIIIPCWFFQSL